jgi:hypothetical protein
MLGAVSVFGYGVPMVVILVLVALVVGLGLAVLFWLTVGLSVYRSVQRTRRQRVRAELRDQLLDVLFDPGADWTGWVEGLSGLERDVVETLLDEYLRELDGDNVEKLQALGDELGIPDRSRRRLAARGEYDRLYALTWLALLDRPDKLRAAGFSPRTPRERASVARLRHESGDLDSTREGIALLLAGATSQFSVFGQDTLYRIATDDPGALFAVAAENYRTWSEPLLVQVLVVCQHLGTSVTTEDLSWLTATLEHESDAVREAATLALGNVGWRSDVRDDSLLERLVDDPAPRVRSAAYRSLARWGDQQALGMLTGAVQTEDDAWARLAGTNALVRQREQLPDDSPPDLETAWAWSSENLEFDTVARRQETGVSD